MAHHRASFPIMMVEEYKSGVGLHQLAAEYRSNNRTVRRWLAERTTIRPMGKKGKI
jgi:hypothetical protein